MIAIEFKRAKRSIISNGACLTGIQADRAQGDPRRKQEGHSSDTIIR